MIFLYLNGCVEHACIDLTKMSPLVGIRNNEFIASHLSRRNQAKLVNKKNASLENQHVFIHFAFDTFGFLVIEFAVFQNMVKRVVHSKFSASKTQSIDFSRIGLAIQKRIAA